MIEIAKEVLEISSTGVRIEIPLKLEKRFYSYGNCSNCKYPLHKIILKDINIAFCLNCGWVKIYDHENGKSISRHINSIQKVYK